VHTIPGSGLLQTMQLNLGWIYFQLLSVLVLSDVVWLVVVMTWCWSLKWPFVICTMLQICWTVRSLVNSEVNTRANVYHNGFVKVWVKPNAYYRFFYLVMPANYYVLFNFITFTQIFMTFEQIINFA